MLTLYIFKTCQSVQIEINVFPQKTMHEFFLYYFIQPSRVYNGLQIVVLYENFALFECKWHSALIQNKRQCSWRIGYCIFYAISINVCLLYANLKKLCFNKNFTTRSYQNCYLLSQLGYEIISSANQNVNEPSGKITRLNVGFSSNSKRGITSTGRTSTHKRGITSTLCWELSWFVSSQHKHIFVDIICQQILYEN